MELMFLTPFAELLQLEFVFELLLVPGAVIIHALAGAALHLHQIIL